MAVDGWWQVRPETACDRLASRALLTGLSAADIEREGLTYRKGKTFEDVKKALTLGFKQGRGKVEHEIAMASLGLERVLKQAKSSKEASK